MELAAKRLHLAALPWCLRPPALWAFVDVLASAQRPSLAFLQIARVEGTAELVIFGSGDSGWGSSFISPVPDINGVIQAMLHHFDTSSTTS